MADLPAYRLLSGHTSQDTALIHRPYPPPLGSTNVRYWIQPAHRGPKRGQQRLVSQTVDPRRGVWRIPTRGPYAPLVILYRDPAGGTPAAVRHWRLGHVPLEPPTDAIWRASGLYDQLDADQRARYDALADAARHSSSRWPEWERALDALAACLQRTDEQPHIGAGYWTAPDGRPHFLGDERSAAAALALARQRLNADRR